MYFQTEPLPISLLEHTVDVRQKALFRSWRQNCLAEAVMEFADDLALLTVNPETQLPVELYTGDRSLAKKVLGDSWQADLAATKGVEKILEAYRIDQFGEPTYQYVCHNGRRDDWLFDVAYERLVLPFKIGGGLPQFVTLSTVVSFDLEPIDARNRNSGPSPLHRTSSQILLGTEQPAS